jgi:hypothetical protein
MSITIAETKAVGRNVGDRGSSKLLPYGYVG